MQPAPGFEHKHANNNLQKHKAGDANEDADQILLASVTVRVTCPDDDKYDRDASQRVTGTASLPATVCEDTSTQACEHAKLEQETVQEATHSKQITHRYEHMLRAVQQQCCRRQMVVLQNGYVIVSQRQGMIGLDEEVIIHPPMLMVMHHR